MRTVLTILGREYGTRIRSRVFLAVTAVTFVLILTVPLVARWAANQGSRERLRVALVDHTGWAAQWLLQAGAPGTIEPVPGTGPMDQLARAVRSRNLAAVLVIGGTGARDLQVAVWTDSPAAFARVQQWVEPALRVAALAQQLQQMGLPASAAAVWNQPITVQWVPLASGQAEAADAGRVALASFISLLTYLGIIAYAGMTFQSVLEEKVSRMMEVVVAAVRPEALLAGKVLGIGLLGLTQYALWATGYMLARLWLPEYLPAPMKPLDIASVTLILLFFTLGFFLYSALYAAVASVISRLEDSQSVASPVTVLVVLAYLASAAVLQDPGGPVGRWFSLVPWTAPTAMVVRVVLTGPPWGDIFLSVGFTLVALLATLWAAARIYRAGVLLYGLRPSLRMLWRLLVAGGV